MQYEIDELDREILQLLEKDSRLSNKQLSIRLHRSLTPIRVRVRRLQQEGFIRRYTVIVDPKRIGLNLIVYTHVQLKEHSQKSLLTFSREVIKLNEVMECYHMTGAFDFLLRIAIRDMNEYNELVMNKLSNLPDVGTMQSFFVMSEAKYETALLTNKNA